MGVGEAARRLHEEQLDARHVTGHLLHVAAQDGGEISVHHGGVATAHELHHGAGLVRGAHLREAQLARDAGRCLLVRGEAVAVHEDNSHAAQAASVRRVQIGTQGHLVQRLQYIALRTEPLLRLDHVAVEQFGQDDAPIKQARAVLVSDAKRIAKAAGGHQQRGLALAFQQRVGGHGGTHLHALHLLGCYRLTGLQAQQVADAGHRRVAVLLGIFGQQLVRDECAVGALANDVGEGAAAVDPELPAGVDVGGRRHGVHKDAADRAAWS